MELISKEELRDRMYHEAFETDSEMQKWESGCWIRYKLFEKILDEVPTIESRPKGKWERTIMHYPYCPICEWIPEEDEMTHGLYNYCPNCGAEMMIQRKVKNNEIDRCR